MRMGWEDKGVFSESFMAETTLEISLSRTRLLDCNQSCPKYKDLTLETKMQSWIFQIPSDARCLVWSSQVPMSIVYIIGSHSFCESCNIANICRNDCILLFICTLGVNQISTRTHLENKSWVKIVHRHPTFLMLYCNFINDSNDEKILLQVILVQQM